MPGKGDLFTRADLAQACDDLATLPYFPHNGRASVMDHLAKMCPHKEALLYVVDAVLAHATSWPGLAELRGVLCNRYTPADGIDAWTSIPGLSAADNEQRAIEQHEEIKKLEKEPDVFTRALALTASRKAL